jgi:hypothetical protein
MNKTKKYIRIAVIILCTIIGCYGILRAPKSDKKDVEKELAHNEQMLMEEESDNTASPTDTIQTAAPSPEMLNTAEAPTDTPAPIQEKSITVIGDSVFLGASQSFKKIYKDAVIDAKISRQVFEAIDIAKKLNKKGKLGDTVIISLGTNGNFNEATGQQLIDYLGKDRTIYWVNVYGENLDTQKDVNNTIDNLVSKNDNVYLINWAKKAKKHPDWFYQDGIHLNTDGQEGFSGFINKSMIL